MLNSKRTNDPANSFSLNNKMNMLQFCIPNKKFKVIFKQSYFTELLLYIQYLIIKYIHVGK